MSENRFIYILGYSGHSYVVIDSILSNNLKVEGYFEKSPVVHNPYNLKYMGDENEEMLIESDSIVFPSVGSNQVRAKMIDFLREKSINQRAFIHSSAQIGSDVEIGNSTLIAPSATINSSSWIGEGVIINTSSVIEHGCRVQEMSHVAPAAVLLGDVSVGKHSFIGSNSVVLNGLSIGDHSVIGAGSVVLENVPSNQTWVGNPAKRIK